MRKLFTPGTIVQNPRTGARYVWIGDANRALKEDESESIIICEDLHVLATPALPDRTVIRTGCGTRTIESFRGLFEKASGTKVNSYNFTNGNWDEEANIIRLISLPTSVAEYIRQHTQPTICATEIKSLVEIPKAIGEAIETIRKNSIHPEKADSLLWVGIPSGAATDRHDAVGRAARQIRAWLRHPGQNGVENMQKYTSALKDGWTPAQTASQRIAGRIMDGELDMVTALEVLKEFGLGAHVAKIKKEIDDSCASCSI